MRRRTRLLFIGALLAAGLAAGACGGGGGHTYKEGTPAATGDAPDCSAVPVDLVKETLKIDVVGPESAPLQDGTGCNFKDPKRSNAPPLATVVLTSNVDKASFDHTRQNFKDNNIPVRNIGGFGDSAYAASVNFFDKPTYTFAARKGKVSAAITSPSEEAQLKALMRAILAKL